MVQRNTCGLDQRAMYVSAARRHVGTGTLDGQHIRTPTRITYNRASWALNNSFVSAMIGSNRRSAHTFGHGAMSPRRVALVKQGQPPWRFASRLHVTDQIA